jgi:ketosteroid isomerase-like protein
MDDAFHACFPLDRLRATIGWPIAEAKGKSKRMRQQKLRHRRMIGVIAVRNFLPIATSVIRFTIVPSERSESDRRTENVMVEDLHRQRVLNLLDAFYAGDIEAAVSHCSDDVDFFSNAPIDILPHLGHRRGKDEVRQMWTSIHSRYSSMRHQVPIVVAEGDKVAVHIRAFLVKRKNDRIMQFDIATFYTFSGGRIVKIREIMDTFDLIQQVVERDLVALLTDDPAGKI